MKNNLNIIKFFKKLNIKKTDTLMIHGDAGIVSQINLNVKNKVNYLINEILDYFSNSGTVIVPTFTYSFTKNKKFDIKNSPSETGLFSEVFRRNPRVSRTKHPIFSFGVFGKFSSNLLNCRIDDCFGKNSVFDLLYKFNGKIVCLGCDIERITFMHYIEQIYGVSYRYFKRFEGVIYEKNKKNKISTTYFIRKLKLSKKLKLEKFEKILINKRLLSRIEFGRFYFSSIFARKLYQESIRMLKKNENFFIK